ncbi:hypothetical protein J2TS4_58080 [Paenibacillus sp. J2TS4]|nr:hypothetical protein J2TS4_58080 [Paenibacillus sp. J2TS4]
MTDMSYHNAPLSRLPSSHLSVKFSFSGFTLLHLHWKGWHSRFSSWMRLIPEHKVGGFIVTNKCSDLRTMIFKAFMDHFYS